MHSKKQKHLLSLLFHPRYNGENVCHFACLPPHLFKNCWLLVVVFQWRLCFSPNVSVASILQWVDDWTSLDFWIKKKLSVNMLTWMYVLFMILIFVCTHNTQICVSTVHSALSLVLVQDIPVLYFHKFPPPIEGAITPPIVVRGW